TGQLSADLLEEAGLVRAQARPRQREDELRQIVGTILRDGQKQKREVATGVVVEPAEQPEVDQREATLGREQDVAPMRIGVVSAFDSDLPDVRAKELARKLLRALTSEPVVGIHLPSLDPLEHEHSLGHIRSDHLGDDEVLVVGQEGGDHFCVVCFLDEVELCTEVLLELVRERSGLEGRSCPSFMYVVPSSSRACRTSCAPSAVAGLFPQTPSSPRTRSRPLRCATRPTYKASLKL